MRGVFIVTADMVAQLDAAYPSAALVDRCGKRFTTFKRPDRPEVHISKGWSCRRPKDHSGPCLAGTSTGRLLQLILDGEPEWP